MDRLIPGALFSPRAAREQRLRQTLQEDRIGIYTEPDDVRDYSSCYDRVSDALYQNDPSGSKLSELLSKGE